MPLLQRAAHIVTAQFHGIVDRLEDPEMMLNQAIRELEDAADSTLHAAATALAHERLLLRRAAELRRQEADLQSRAVESLQHQNEAQSRGWLAERMRLTQLREATEVSAASAAETSLCLRKRLEQLQGNVRDLRQRTTELSVRKRVAVAAALAARNTTTGRQLGSLSKVARWIEQLEQSEAEADAWLELSGIQIPDEGAQESSDLEAEFVQMKESLRS